MKWRRVKSDKVIDIRGASGDPGGRRGGLGAGGMRGIPLPGGVKGLGGGGGLIAIIVIVLIQVIGGGGGGALGGIDIGKVLGAGAQPAGADNPQPLPPGEDPQRDLKDFSTSVFVDVQRMWRQALRADGRSYRDAELVLYSKGVNTGGCGSATSAVGPFYCSGDNRVYLDLTFYDDMRKQLGASGDFAWAYVIAHEMGHHIQNVIGTSDEVSQEQRDHPDQANALSVRLELQADCYAGVWANTVFKRGDLEDGDIDEAFNAAEAVGDDRLQKRATGRVDPDTFTHGTSKQRRKWFDAGYESADPSACDTFSAESL